MKVVTYGRVSSHEQAEHGTSLADQRRRLTARALDDGHEHVQHFEDGGRTGGSMDRPGLTALRALVARGGIDVVYATKMDRVARSTRDLANLLHELADHGCALKLIDDGIDTSTAAGAMHSQILSSVAEFEANRIADRTGTGRRAKAEEGWFVGSTAPYGYQVTGAPGARRLEVDRTQARAIRLIYERLVVARVPAKHVATVLNEEELTPARKEHWDAATLRRWAKDPSHIRAAAGVWMYDGIEVPHRPIITAPEAAVWKSWAREARSVHPQRAPQRYMLAGLVVMPCARRAMGRTATGQAPTYSCRDRLTAGISGHQECYNLHAPTLEITVIQAVRERLLEPAVLRAAVADANSQPSPGSELVRVQAELTALDDEIAGVVALLREEGLRRESVSRALRPLKDRQDALEARARGLRRKVAEESVGPDRRHIRQAVDRLRSGLASDDRDTWRQVLEVLHVVVRVEGHVACGTCAGSRFLHFEPGTGRRPPRRCPACFNGREPILEVEMDDVVALALADGMGQAG